MSEKVNKKGVAFITVKIRFELDLSDEEIDQVIQEADYTIKHPFIESTEITEIQQL